MRTTAIFLLILGAFVLSVLALCRPNYIDNDGLITSGGLSTWLNYAIEFHPATGGQEAAFVATLTNVSSNTLDVTVNDRKFHASFAVTPRAGKAYQVFDREYYGLLTSATWSEPVTVLAPSHSITWVVPLTSLEVGGGIRAPVTEELLSGCTVSSEMTMAILPKLGLASGCVTDNATQNSKSIHIP